MDQAVFADVQVSGARPAPPVVGEAAGEVVLKPVQAAVAVLSIVADLAENAFFTAVQRLHGAVAVMNDTQRAGETQLDSAVGYDFGVFRVANSSADDRVYIYCKLSKVGEVLQFLVENLQALLRHVVWMDIINTDLKVLQTCLVQTEDFFRREQITIGYDAGYHSVMPDPPDDFFNLGMHQRLTAADGHDGGFQVCQPVDAPDHLVGRHGG